jgi:O-antigen ligase
MLSLTWPAHSRVSGNPEAGAPQLGPRFRGDERTARRTVSIEALRGALLWCMGLSGAFVFIEPSPYELVGLLTILVFAVTGLSLRPAIAPLALALIIINIGYAIAVVQVSDQTKPVNWVLISVFLAVTAIFYASMLGRNTQRRLRLLLRGYMLGALIASLVAIAAYFQLLGGKSELFMLYSRARGTFNDPNVLAAFVALPALLLFRRMLAGRLISAIPLLVLLAALFLTFSRGGWAQFAFAAAILMILSFLTSRFNTERIRILMIALVGAVAVAGLIMGLLSSGKVADLFKERAALEQSYDVGRYGRFGRYGLGAEVALEHPFGIGPLQFTERFVEDPHNTFLNEFMSGGWVAGLTYFALCAITLMMSTRFLFVRTPWLPLYHVLYAAYVAVVAESTFIDIEHWRHYFLILGVLWGLMAASRAYAREHALARFSRAPSAAMPGAT